MFKNRFLPSGQNIVALKYKDRLNSVFTQNGLVIKSSAPSTKGYILYIDTVDPASTVGFLYVLPVSGTFALGDNITQSEYYDSGSKSWVVYPNAPQATLTQVEEISDPLAIPEINSRGTGFIKNLRDHWLASHIYALLRNSNFRFTAKGRLGQEDGILHFYDNAYLTFQDLPVRIRISVTRSDESCTVNIPSGGLACTATAGPSPKKQGVKNGDFLRLSDGRYAEISNLNLGTGEFDIALPDGFPDDGIHVGCFFYNKDYDFNNERLPIDISGTQTDFNLAAIDIPEIEPELGAEGYIDEDGVSLPQYDIHLTDILSSDQTPSSSTRGKGIVTFGTYHNGNVTLINGTTIANGQVIELSGSDNSSEIESIRETIQESGKITQSISSANGVSEIYTVNVAYIPDDTITFSNETTDIPGFPYLVTKNIFQGKPFLSTGDNDGEYLVQSLSKSSIAVPDGLQTLGTVLYPITNTKMIADNISVDLSTAKEGHKITLDDGVTTFDFLIKEVHDSGPVKYIIIDDSNDASVEGYETTMGESNALIGKEVSVVGHEYFSVEVVIESDPNLVPPDFLTEVVASVAGSVRFYLDVIRSTVGGDVIYRIDSAGNIHTKGKQFVDIVSVIKEGGVVGDNFEEDEFRVNARTIMGGATDFTSIAKITGDSYNAQLRKSGVGWSGLDMVGNDIGTDALVTSILAREYESGGETFSIRGDIRFQKDTTYGDAWEIETDDELVARFKSDEFTAWKNILPYDRDVLDIGESGISGRRINNIYAKNIEFETMTGIDPDFDRINLKYGLHVDDNGGYYQEKNVDSDSNLVGDLLVRLTLTTEHNLKTGDLVFVVHPEPTCSGLKVVRATPHVLQLDIDGHMENPSYPSGIKKVYILSNIGDTDDPVSQVVTHRAQVNAELTYKIDQENEQMRSRMGLGFKNGSSETTWSSFYWPGYEDENQDGYTTKIGRVPVDVASGNSFKIRIRLYGGSYGTTGIKEYVVEFNNGTRTIHQNTILGSFPDGDGDLYIYNKAGEDGYRFAIKSYDSASITMRAWLEGAGDVSAPIVNLGELKCASFSTAATNPWLGPVVLPTWPEDNLEWTDDTGNWEVNEYFKTEVIPEIDVNPGRYSALLANVVAGYNDDYAIFGGGIPQTEDTPGGIGYFGGFVDNGGNKLFTGLRITPDTNGSDNVARIEGIGDYCYLGTGSVPFYEINASTGNFTGVYATNIDATTATIRYVKGNSNAVIDYQESIRIVGNINTGEYTGLSVLNLTSDNPVACVGATRTGDTAWSNIVYRSFIVGSDSVLLVAGAETGALGNYLEWDKASFSPDATTTNANLGASGKFWNKGFFTTGIDLSDVGYLSQGSSEISLYNDKDITDTISRRLSLGAKIDGDNICGLNVYRTDVSGSSKRVIIGARRNPAGGFEQPCDHLELYAGSQYMHYDGSAFYPNATDNTDLGTTDKRFKNLYLSGNIFGDGTCNMTGFTSIGSNTTTISGGGISYAAGVYPIDYSISIGTIAVQQYSNGDKPYNWETRGAIWIDRFDNQYRLRIHIHDGVKDGTIQLPLGDLP